MAKFVTRGDRQAAATRAEAAYTTGASIRDVAAQENVSFGLARQLLLEAGVTLRGRGGYQPPKNQ